MDGADGVDGAVQVLPAADVVFIAGNRKVAWVFLVSSITGVRLADTVVRTGVMVVMVVMVKMGVLGKTVNRVRQISPSCPSWKT